VLLYQYSPVATVPNRLGRSRAISCFLRGVPWPHGEVPLLANLLRFYPVVVIRWKKTHHGIATMSFLISLSALVSLPSEFRFLTTGATSRWLSVQTGFIPIQSGSSIHRYGCGPEMPRCLNQGYNIILGHSGDFIYQWYEL